MTAARAPSPLRRCLSRRPASFLSIAIHMTSSVCAPQLYLGHSSAGTESAGPPDAKTVALTAPLPLLIRVSSP